MTADPWTVIGWLIVVILGAGIVAVPAALVMVNVHRRRAIDRIEGVRNEMHRGGPLGPRADRWAAPPPRPAGSPPPPRPKR